MYTVWRYLVLAVPAAAVKKRVIVCFSLNQEQDKLLGLAENREKWLRTVTAILSSVDPKLPPCPTLLDFVASSTMTSLGTFVVDTHVTK